jgi:hypothetical protein
MPLKLLLTFPVKSLKLLPRARLRTRHIDKPRRSRRPTLGAPDKTVDFDVELLAFSTWRVSGVDPVFLWISCPDQSGF